MTDASSDRLRIHPRERFAAEERRFDLNATADKLVQEQGAPGHGHRQMVLYRHGPTTVALFLFDRDAGLREHKADGFITIHCLQGRLVVHTPGAEYELPADTLLTLAPNVPHDVLAEEDSRMLLTVALEHHDGEQG